MGDSYKFETHIVGLSESDDIREALGEWIFVNFRLGEKDTKIQCVCGRIFWKDIYVYCNELNGNTIHAGSTCDKHFKHIQRMGRSTKNELLSDFMSSEMGVYENIYDYMTYSEDVRNRLCNHIESQICAINSVALERLLHGVEAIIAGLKSKNHNTDDLERFIPMIQAAMAGARVTEEAERVRWATIQARWEAERVQKEADRMRQEAEQLAKEEAEQLAKEEAAQFMKEEEQRKVAMAEAARMLNIEREAEQARRLKEEAAEKERLIEIKKKEALAAEEKWRSSDRSDPKAFNEAVEKWAEKQRILTKPS